MRLGFGYLFGLAFKLLVRISRHAFGVGQDVGVFCAWSVLLALQGEQLGAFRGLETMGVCKVTRE